MFTQVLRNLDHQNVIKFIGIMFKKEKHLNLILEFISGGTLKDIIHNIDSTLKEARILKNIKHF